jgi:hypothetical protein
LGSVTYGGNQVPIPGDSRVEEFGILLEFHLVISGCAGKDVPVQVYAKDSAGRETFLAEAIAKPPHENTSWKAFPVPVPLSRFAGLNNVSKLAVYVCSPGNRAEFIGQVSYDLTSPIQTPLVWSWESWADEATNPAGEKGFRLKVRLDAQGIRGKVAQLVLVLQNSDGLTLRGSDSDELILPLGTLNTNYSFSGDSSYWQNLEFYAPYSFLEHLRPGFLVFAYPAIRVDGKLIGGNIRAKFWAGGSLDTVYEKFNAQSAKVNDEVRRIENRMKAVPE